MNKGVKLRKWRKKWHEKNGPVLFLVFINDLPDSLENPLYAFADDCTLCRTIGHPSDRQAAASSLTADLDKITNWSSNTGLQWRPVRRFIVVTLTSFPAESMILGHGYSVKI